MSTLDIPTWIDHFPGNFMWSNATLVTKGMAPYGAVALGEIDEVCERLRSRQDEPHAWWEEWSTTAARLEKTADEAEAAGHSHTAGNYYLRAGMYYFTAERFIVPSPAKRAMGEKAIDCQTKGIFRRYSNVERLEIPYEGTTLPALFMKSSSNAGGRAPAIVLFDGLDNCKEMSVLFAGLEFANRGWNTLAIDGPGQGESLRLRDIKARYDYEVAGTATYDYLAARPDVDPARMAVMGYSFGGYYAPRIAAFDHRYIACVAFGAMHWNMVEWVRTIRDIAADPKRSSTSHFQVPWVFGAADLDEAAELAAKFSLTDVADSITCSFLIAHGEADRIVPLADAVSLLKAVGSRDKALRIFTAEDGGAEHVQVDNRQVGVDAIADWLSARLN